MKKYNELNELRFFGSLDFFADLLEGGEKINLVCIAECSTGIAWAEFTDSILGSSYIPALKVCLNSLRDYYNVEFKDICTNNSIEFREKSRSYEFNEMMLELNVAHSFHNKYKFRANKCEMFYSYFQSYMLNKKVESLEHFKENLKAFLFSYNEKKLAV